MRDLEDISIRELDGSSLDSIQGLLERSRDVSALSISALGFPLSRKVLEDKTTRDPDFEEELFLGAYSGTEAVGCVFGVRRPWKTGKEGQGWIKFLFVKEDFRRRGVGRKLLESIEKRLASRGANTLTFGSSSPSYLFPGIPLEDTALLALFERGGWQKSSVRVHLVADLTEESEGRFPGVEVDLEITVEVSTAKLSEEPEVMAFVEAHFSKSWALEILPACTDSTGSRDAFISIARDVKAGAVERPIVGFAAFNCTNPNWLGPMGVAKTWRKQGVGRLLLLHNRREALHNLGETESRGTRRIVIPWVNEEAGKFYAHVIGARVSSQFWKVEKKLG